MLKYLRGQAAVLFSLIGTTNTGYWVFLPALWRGLNGLTGRKISIVVNEHMGLGIVVKQRHVQELIDYTSEMIRTKNEGKQAAGESADR